MDVQELIGLPQQYSCAFDVICGSSVLAENLIKGVSGPKAYFDPKAVVKLVLDVPQGYAFPVIEALNACPNRTDLRLVVVSFSTCTEYLHDLWDLRPHILLDDVLLGGLDAEKSMSDLVEVLLQASKGRRYATISDYPITALNTNERRILHLLVRGHSNKNIAAELNLQEKTVRNLLTSIYNKLNIENRIEAVLYYWGPGSMHDLIGDGHGRSNGIGNDGSSHSQSQFQPHPHTQAPRKLYQLGQHR
jgi:DNA-binding CsgD family transcriptional regulator